MIDITGKFTIIPEETDRGNKLISIFMGGYIDEVWKIKGVSEYAWKGEVAHKWRKERLGISIGDAILCRQLEFRTSWEWIIPVVDKIESISNDKYKKVSVSITDHNCLIYANMDRNFVLNPITNTCFTTKLEAVWNSVVEFVDA